MSDKDFASASSSFQAVFQLGESDQLLNESLKFLGSADGGSRIAVSDELALKIGQQCHALIGRKPQLAVVYLVCHGSSSLGSGLRPLSEVFIVLVVK